MTLKIRLLVAAKSTEKAKSLVVNLGVDKVKFDSTRATINGHFILEIEAQEDKLTDNFYKKIHDSESMSILSDEASLNRAKIVLDYVAPIEYQLRELAAFPYKEAPLYLDKMIYKASGAKRFKDKELIIKGETDSLLGYLDFGDMLTFLGSDAKKIDSSDLPNEIAKMMNQSATFDEFKSQYSGKFLKLKIWDYIAKAVLKTSSSWDDIESDLKILKDIRNAALHFRTITPSDAEKAKEIAASMDKVFVRKRMPGVKDIDNLSSAIGSYNISLIKRQQELLNKIQAENTARQIDSLNNLIKSMKVHFTDTLPESSISGTVPSLQEAYDTLRRYGDISSGAQGSTEDKK